MRIWPSDLDVYGHVNNGRYLTLMDFGRLAFILRTRLMPVFLRRRWTPVLGGATCHFLREMRAFERVELVTRIVCWDEKWFYFEQRFEQAGRTRAVGLTQVVLRKNGRTVPPQRALAVLGHHAPSPPAPDIVVRWSQTRP